MIYPCYKCNGTGQTSFKHIENGVCFTCAGSGQLSYRKAEKVSAEPHPELVVAETARATDKQWSYLIQLTGQSDVRFCKAIKAAGAKIANQKYVSRAIISKAIEMARTGH